MTEFDPALHPERLGRVSRRIFAVALGFVVALLAVELGYRVVRAPVLSPTTNPAYVEYDPLLGWRYRPGVQERHKSDEFDVTIEINSRGFRGPEWGARSEGRRRVLVVGDSLGFGWGVEYERTFPALLADRIRDCDFLDACVSGYGTDQELLLLEKLAPELAPDLVVAVFCENDLYENLSDVSYGRHKPHFVEEGGRLELAGVPVPYPWMERASYVVRAFAKRGWEVAMERRAPDTDREWALVCDLYRKMRDASQGAPLIVVSDRQRLADLAREEPSIHHVDLRPAFAASAERVTFETDKHWTPAGHELVARALEEPIRALLASRR